jgi:hypothetical protein
MEAVAVIVALIAVLASSEEGGEQAASKRPSPRESDEYVVPVVEEFTLACDNTSVIYRDLSRPYTSYEASFPFDATEGNE